MRLSWSSRCLEHARFLVFAPDVRVFCVCELRERRTEAILYRRAECRGRQSSRLCREDSMEAKLRLDLNALAVESFEAPNTQPAPTERENAASCLDTYCPPRQCCE